MTQFNPPAINPAVTSGSDLANYLEGVRDASYSTHKGTSRPSYARDGLLWMKEVSSTAWEIYAISGPKDVLIGTIDPTNAIYTASNVAGVYLKSEVDIIIATLNSNLSALSTTVAGKADTATVAAATTPPGSMVFYGGRRAPSGYLKCNGASYTAASQPALFAALVFSSNATITIGADATVAWANHGLGVNDPVKFTTTGSLPTGLVVGTTYYVAAAGLATNSFRISATPGGATITTSGTQSGTHKAISAP
ncbi:phage tail protein [Xanthobacter autotrophicus]|uniref:phage tail protein n=1 Tax=Xanthobacter autotrophicus TaxID=280 RepID=UPI00372CB4E0